MKPLADRCFDASCALSLAESELYDFLWPLVGEDTFDDMSFDYYDRSLELLGCAPELRLTGQALAEILAAGFQRVWLNHTDQMETYYSEGQTEGHRKPSPSPRKCGVSSMRTAERTP